MDDIEKNRSKRNMIRRPQAPSSMGSAFGNIAGGSTKPSSRTASSLVPKMLMFSFRDRTDATAKRRFGVQVPMRMVRYVLLVFFVLPVVFFAFKETNLKSNKKLEGQIEHKHRIPKANTQDVFSHLAENVNRTSSEVENVRKNNSGDTPKGDATDEASGGSENEQGKDITEKNGASSSSDSSEKSPAQKIVLDLEKKELEIQNKTVLSATGSESKAFKASEDNSNHEVKKNGRDEGEILIESESEINERQDQDKGVPEREHGPGENAR